MTDRPEVSPWLRPFGGLLVATTLAISPLGLAQAQGTSETDAPEEIVVTGSRIKRDTYSSVAPLQVISNQVSRQIGSIDPSSILQDSSAAGGQQVDITYQGFVTDNGPGSSTIDLRGLGEQRTLVLINGRRAAPVGVEGAPFAPDLNIIPRTLVDSYEVLLDGASSVYGSDALAGVVNIIMRKDFDGLELEAYSNIPDHSGGVENTISAAWGMNTDRGFFGVAVDYSDGEAVDRRDRPWSEECESYYEITRDGEIRNEFIGYQNDYTMNSSPCLISFGAQRVFDNFGQFGSIYYTPGETNTGIPNFSEATLFDAWLDQDADGVVDVDFTDYFVLNDSGVQHLLPERERISAMAYGEYTFSGEMNITPYFEALYNKRETFAQRAPSSLATVENLDVPADNPYNICNPNGIRGVDCNAAYNSVLTSPEYIFQFGTRYEDLCAAFGFTFEQCTPSLFGLFPTTQTGARAIQPDVAVSGDTDFVDTEVDQLRLVAGVRWDMPFLNFGQFGNWSGDLSVVHSDGNGISLRTGVREDLLRYSVDTTRVENGEIVCGDATGGPDNAPCVPVDMFAPSLYENLTGNDFATQAERDYLFADRTFDTEYTQSLFQLILTGDLFDMPAGTVAAAFGYEHREDEINSIPNRVAAEGLLAGFFKDLGAVGEKTTKEFFGEVEIPLLAGEPGFEELTFNISSRYTDDEFFDGAWTYSAKLSWRPVDSLLLKGTVGTSYRAPNLRENFLQGQTGFRTLFDPCVTPDSAIVPQIGGGFEYFAPGDDRSQTVIDNCFAAGVDPTFLGVTASGQTIDTYSVEVLTGVGQIDLVEENSESWTAGFAWDVPFLQSAGLTLGATYYEIRIEDEIIELFSQTSINNCYNDPEGDSVFCRNIDRRTTGDGLIFNVDEAFLNRDALKTRGVDLNLSFDWPVQMFGRAVDLSGDFNFNRKLEYSDKFFNIDTQSFTTDSDLGEFGLPEWEGQMILRADINDFRATWSTRYISSVSADPDTLEAEGWGGWSTTGTTNTCLGEAAGDVDCRPIGWAENYFRHDMSLYYYGDQWTFGGGVRNVFDESPPKVDRRVVFSRWNTPFGAGYDIQGRTFFVNVAVRFDDLTF